MSVQADPANLTTPHRRNQQAVLGFQHQVSGDAFQSRAPDLLNEAQWRAIAQLLRLSDREAQILRYACYDDSVLVMAQRMRLSRHTVHTYRERVFRKLGVRSLCQVVSLAFAAFVHLSGASGSDRGDPLPSRKC
jgi:DNA-binding CsgD family transcriptional regulator